MNLKDLLHKKAEYPVRIIALENDPTESTFKCYEKGDEIGIEVVDFSIGNMRVCNKKTDLVFEIYYNKDNWEIKGEWEFKKIE